MLDLAFTLLGRLASVAVSFVTSVAVARTLSRELAGFYFWMLSSIALATIVVSLGIASVAAGKLASAVNRGGADAMHKRVFEISNTLLMVGTMASFFLLLLAGLIAFIGHTDISRTIRNWSGIVLIACFVGYGITMAEVFRYVGRPAQASLVANLAANILFLIALAVGFVMRSQITAESILMTQIGATALIALVAHINICKIFGGYRCDILSWSFIRSVSIPVVITNIGAFAIMQAHMFVASVALQPADNAAYGAATRVALIVGLVPVILQGVVVPNAGRVFARGDSAAAEQLIRSTTTVASIVIAPLLLTLIGFPAQILDFLFGRGYSDGGLILQILVISSLINVVRGFPGLALMQFGYQRDQAFITATGGVFAMILLMLAYLSASAVLIAMTVLVSTIVQGGLEHILLKRRLQMSSCIDFTLLRDPAKLWRAIHVR